MNTYTFKFDNNKKYTTPSNNYTTILDDIITSSIIKKNSYLFDTPTTKTNIFVDKIVDSAFDNIVIKAALKDSEFAKAAKFLANYNKKTTLPFTFGKIYKLSDGTPIIFYDNEIQIGADCYLYNDFGNLSFLDSLTSDFKKTIIDIYTNGMKISIKI